MSISQIKYIITHEIIEPIREILYAVIFGSKKITPIYSVEGILTGIQFLVIMVILGSIYSVFEYFQNPLLTYIVQLFLFYAYLLITQKRCRDFGSTGTLWILIVSLAFIGNMAFHFADTQMLGGFLKEIYLAAFGIQIAAFLFLLIIPSKQKSALTARSCLLKYPFLYLAICWTLAVVATIMVNNYVGISIT